MGYKAIFVPGIDEPVSNIYSGLGYAVQSDTPRWLGVFDAEKTGLLLAEVNAGILKDLIAKLVEDHSVVPRVGESDSRRCKLHQHREVLFRR